MSIAVNGIGWITKEGYGSVRTGSDHRFNDGESVKSLAKLWIFSHPFRNFPRLDNASHLTVSAIALALKDAGVDYLPSEKQGIGIIGTGHEGSMQSDIDYFRDFVENGRTLSRANLFIYTLPSSAMGEGAIHFGLTGPLMFASEVGSGFAGFINMAADMISSGEAGSMLVGRVSADEALYLLIADSPDQFCSLSEAASAIESSNDFQDIIRNFSRIKEAGKA